MSETEAYDRVLSCVMNHPLNREALIEILRYCEQERDQADVEAHMQAPSAAYSALLSPYRLICQLVDAGGIVCTEVDADGEPGPTTAKRAFPRTSSTTSCRVGATKPPMPAMK